MKTVFNAEALVKIELHDRKVCERIVWLEAAPPTLFERLFFYRGREAGFYTKELIFDNGVLIYADEISSGKYTRSGFDSLFVYQDIPLLVDGKNVYYRPYVKMHFSGGIKKVVEFNSYKEAEAFTNEQVSKGMNVTIEFED